MSQRYADMLPKTASDWAVYLGIPEAHIPTTPSAWSGFLMRAANTGNQKIIEGTAMCYLERIGRVDSIDGFMAYVASVDPVARLPSLQNTLAQWSRSLASSAPAPAQAPHQAQAAAQGPQAHMPTAAQQSPATPQPPPMRANSGILKQKKVFIIVGIVVLLLAGWYIVNNTGSNALVGTWELEDAVGISRSALASQVEFFSDGRAIMDGRTGLTWSSERGRLILTNALGSADAYSYKISGSILTITYDSGDAYSTYRRVR